MLAGLVGLQVLAVHWPPAQQLFATTALSATQWMLAAGVASLVLWLEESHKLLASFGKCIRSKPLTSP